MLFQNSESPHFLDKTTIDEIINDKRTLESPKPPDWDTYTKEEKNDYRKAVKKEKRVIVKEKKNATKYLVRCLKRMAKNKEVVLKRNRKVDENPSKSTPEMLVYERNFLLSFQKSKLSMVKPKGLKNEEIVKVKLFFLFLENQYPNKK